MVLRWGVANRWVCWLVQPSVFDCRHLPDDYTLRYVLTEPYMGRPGRVLYQSIDRSAVAFVSRELHYQRTAHDIHTEWYDPEGRWCHKQRKKEV